MVFPKRLLPITEVAILTSPDRAAQLSLRGQRTEERERETDLRLTTSVKLRDATAQRKSETQRKLGDAVGGKRSAEGLV